MPMSGSVDIASHYRVLVSPVTLRPQALLYPFNLPQPLPQVTIPLRADDREPVIDFQNLLTQVYEVSGYQFSIDYAQPPRPGWETVEFAWIKETVS